MLSNFQMQTIHIQIFFKKGVKDILMLKILDLNHKFIKYKIIIIHEIKKKNNFRLLRTFIIKIYL
jgi:hypothetical protein